MAEINGETSDGYHTFNELYAHRNLLFVLLMRHRPARSWRSRLHSDHTAFDGFFIAGMRLPDGDITYHLPNDLWEMLDGTDIETSAVAPEWDGHTSEDVLNRLRKWAGKVS